eukprot:scaffold44492_cov48-Phaeocystis_antarctica.AAC.1
MAACCSTLLRHATTLSTYYLLLTTYYLLLTILAAPLTTCCSLLTTAALPHSGGRAACARPSQRQGGVGHADGAAARPHALLGERCGGAVAHPGIEHGSVCALRPSLPATPQL